MLEGAVIAKISGQEERTFTAGQTFYEPPGSIHEVSKNASQTQPAKLLALNFAKKGLPRTIARLRFRDLDPFCRATPDAYLPLCNREKYSIAFARLRLLLAGEADAMPCQESPRFRQNLQRFILSALGGQFEDP